MKKLFTVLLTSLFAFTLVGCGGSNKGPTELVEATSREVQTMDYLVTALATDHELNSNFVDGLLENDNYGKLVGALAESYEANEDATVWTFKLKQGVKWATSTGEEYGEVKAQDFVTGLRHGAEFNSATAWLLDGVVEGYTHYRKESDLSDEEWEKVGVKALDDYTVQYTLEASTPYFASMATYAVLYPVNKDFLESKGEGCKLGSPDDDTCDFGTVELDSILYNGAYIMTKNDPKSSAVLEANPLYWDAEHVYLKKITRLYDDGSDPYSIIKGFEQGTYSATSLNPGWEDYAAYKEKYAGKTYYSLPNASVFGVVFNFNRQVWNETNYATTDEAKANTHNAILNANFRRALRAAFDRVAYNAVSAPVDLAEASLRNVNNFPGAGSADGKDYMGLVTDAYKEMTGQSVDLSDGQNPWDPATAMDYINKAKAEGVNFPVHLDMLVIDTADRLVKQAASMKKSVEEATQGNIVIELVMRDEDTVQNIAYHNMDPAQSDYDISTFTGWSPDYADPKSYVDIYSPVTGYYMTSCGLQTGKGNADVKAAVGFDKYEELYRAADAITDDLEARYKAYAKADAYLVDQCLFIPGYMQSRGEIVSKVVPFTRPIADTGISEFKYKGMQLQNDIVTTEQYEAAYAEYMKNK